MSHTPALLTITLATLIATLTFWIVIRAIDHETPPPEPLNTTLTTLKTHGHLLTNHTTNPHAQLLTHATNCWCTRPPRPQPRSRRHRLRIDP